MERILTQRKRYLQSNTTFKTNYHNFQEDSVYFDLPSLCGVFLISIFSAAFIWFRLKD